MPMFDQVEQGEIRRLARQEIKINNTSIEGTTFDRIDDMYWDESTLHKSLYMPNGYSLGTAPHAWVSASGASFNNSTITFGPVCTLTTTTTANSRASIRQADQDIAIAPTFWNFILYENAMLDMEWRGRVKQGHSNIGKGSGQAAVIVGIERSHATNNQIVHGFMRHNGNWWIVIVSEYIEYYSFDTGISTDDMHTLRVVTGTHNGSADNLASDTLYGNRIYFYIDGVLIQTLTNGVGGVVLASEYPANSGAYFGCHVRQRGAGNPAIIVEVESMVAKRSKVVPHEHLTMRALETNYISAFPATYVPSDPLGVGQVSYQTDYKSLGHGVDGGANGSITAPLGSALIKLIRNNTGSTITKGKVVYINGSHASTQITVALADASTETTAKDTIGVAAQNIANNTEGWIITQGYLKGFATNGTTGTGGEGSTLWLSTTAGAFTYDRPTSPDHGVAIGFMVKEAGGGAGSIYVKIQNGQELEELHDVLITNIANNNVLQWDNSDSRWENRSLTAAGIMADQANPNSPVLFYDDFLSANNEAGEIGIQGWNFLNLSLPQIAGEQNHPGVVRLRCSSTANQVGYMTTALTNAGSTNQFRCDEMIDFTFIFKDVQTEQDTWRIYGIVGTGTSLNQPDGIYVRKNLAGITTGTWEFVTRTGAAETVTTWTAQDTNWHKIYVTYATNSVKFFVDGSTTASATHTTNIPTTTIVAPFISLTPTGSTLTRTNDIDFFSYRLNGPTR